MAAQKKLKVEDIVGRLDNLHSDIIAHRLDHLDAQDVSQSLDLHQSCDFGSESKLVMSQERDVCLVKLSITTILFDKVGNVGKDGNLDDKKLQEICRRLLLQDYKLLEYLDLLFGSGDQLVAYTACKTAASVLVHFPTELQPFPKTWLSGLLQQVTESPHSSRALCTFDLFKLVIRALGNSVPSIPEESDSAAAPKGTGVACFHILEENWDQLTRLYLKECQSLTEQQTSHQPPTSNEGREVAFLSLLSLWIECLNIEVGTVSQLRNTNVLLELVQTLKRTESSLVYANILEVFSQILAHEQDEAGVDSETVTSVARSLLKTVDDNMIERVPWKDQHVGFGGTGYIEGQLVEGEKPGDWVLVRTLVLVLLKACSVVSGLSGPEEALDIFTSLRRLSSFVCKKLAETAEGHAAEAGQYAGSQTESWLFELFSDQDDSMIEAMLCLLDINTAVSRCTTDCPHADVLRSLNPHHIFLQFLETTTWDHSILLDLLISMETCFLAYITRYLHLVITEWQVFQETNQLYHQTITTIDTCGSSDGGIESSWKDLVIPNSNKTSFNQIGEKKCKSPPPPQLDHTRRKLSQQSGAQPSDQTSEKVLDDIELEGIPALGVVTMSLSEFNRFEMDIAGQQLQALGANVDTVQSTNPQGQDFQGQDLRGQDLQGQDLLGQDLQGQDLQGQDLQHDSKTGGTCEGETDDSFSDSSDDDKSSDNAEEESTLDKTMGVLIRLRLAVERLSEKKLFPYNVSPLLRLLTRVETRYEEE